MTNDSSAWLFPLNFLDLNLIYPGVIRKVYKGSTVGFSP